MTAKKCTKKCDAGAKLLFFSVNLLLLFFLVCFLTAGSGGGGGGVALLLEVMPLEFERNFIEAELLSVVELGSNISWPREEIC